MTDAPKKSPFDERFMTVKELADMHGISATTVYGSLWKWPHLRTKAKGVVRFREAHVAEILESMTARPKPPSVRPNVGTQASRRRHRLL
jgi:predicted DNA-binding transcriptional regulator AlpA